MAPEGAVIIPFSSKELDITDHEALKKEIVDAEADIIINCAAYTKVDKAEKEQDLANAVNFKAVKSLIDIAEDQDALLVHFSTDYVFPGSEGDREKYPNGYPEDAATKPSGVYAKSKWLGEQQMLNHSYKNWLLIRVAWLCGYAGNNFVKTMIRLTADKDELRVVADQFGSPSFTENVAYNTWNLISQEAKGIYHIASEDESSWFEIAKETARWMGVDCQVRPIPSEDFPTPVERPKYSRLDISKLRNVPNSRLYDWRTQLQVLLTELS
jgi:dTDP-4-dehydrorhamnose reductase